MTQGTLIFVKEALKNAQTVVAQYNDSAPEMSQDRAMSGAIKSQIEEAITRLDTLLDSVPDLEVTLMNAVKPEYDLHIICPHCREEGTTNNGEWLIWCGPKSCAEKLLEAAQLLATEVRE